MITTPADGEAQIVESVTDILKSFAQAAARACLPETDAHGNPNLGRFLIENRRLPSATDEIKPWAYRGWLVPYLQLCELHPDVAKRYEYVSRTLDAGELLDEPLPPIHFIGEFEAQTKAGMAMLDKLLERIAYESGNARGIGELCEWTAFALGVTHEPSKLKNEMQEFLYRNFNLEPLVLYPSDYLGQMLTASNHGKKSGFYPTPMHLCELMAQLTGGHKPGDRRHEQVCDPCVGTGRMLLAASNYSMRLFGQDIDYLCCLITKINLALYAPWFYIPASFFEGEEQPGKPNLGDEGETRLKDEAEPNKSQIEPAHAAYQTANPELSRFEKLRTEKQKRSAGKKHTTRIENLPLFDLK